MEFLDKVQCGHEPDASTRSISGKEFLIESAIVNYNQLNIGEVRKEIDR